MNNNNRQIRNGYLFIIVFISTLIVSSTIMSNYAHTSNTNLVYGQIIPDLVDSNNTISNLVNIQDIPLEKVRVGDIEMAYKIFGKGDPLILHNGASDNMDAWDPALLTRLASNNTVIVFDSRGIGNTTVGAEPYSIKLLGNDTAGLMDALKIQQANVLGYSMGTFTTQQFAITHPDKVSSIILIAGSCGGKDTIPKPPEFLKLQEEIANKTKNNITVSNDEFKSLVTASLGSGWIKLHPESAEIPENISLLGSKPGLSPEMLNNQADAGWGWEAQDWSGVCDDLAKIDKPLLVITGTDDNQYNPHQNALVFASKVPGTWVVQIKDAGHAVPNQYPDEVGSIIETFLSTIK